MTDQLGPDFDERLGAELDRGAAPTPLPANARFHRSPSGYHPITGRKLALAAASAVAVLLLSATVLARSPNPAVWVRTVQSVAHPVESSPSPSSENAPPAQAPPAAHAEPARTAQPSHESPEPPGDARTEPSGWPTPSPERDQSPGQSPSPSPSPSPEGGYSGSRSPSPSPSPSPSGSEH
jgi:hypothetical protein